MPSSVTGERTDPELPVERGCPFAPPAAYGMVAAQGLGILAGGLLVEAAGPEHGLAIAGAAGLVAGVPVLLAWNRATRTVTRWP
ncbi:hypothetical protein [Nonomuraea diastatica]|uniref:hypothetical protein n=1 Tax=Nonomuraea diastatica TaxID=1848329 RepID=UPI00140B1948|nr:hypothetical protein [Nonomuraea diastatica]